MQKSLMDAIVRTDYGQMDLIWSWDGGFDGDVDRFFAGQVNGLVGAGDPNGVYFHLGRRYGGSHVQVVLCSAPPPEVEGFWEDVVEASLTVPPGSEVRVTSWTGESSWPLELPAGSYRLRVNAHGRDAGEANEFADRIVDHYLLQLWPAPPEDDAIIRVGSKNARYWHALWGSRRDQ